MSSTKTKRYLMLLAAVGLVAAALGGTGTFASFNAEVANGNNYFATGTLLLHNTSGGTTCTSEAASNNTNTNVTTNGCATLFSVNLNTVRTNLSSGASGVTTSLSVNALPATVGIDAGDTITVTQGANSQTFTVSLAAAPGATTINISSANISPAFTSGAAVTYDGGTHFAQLKLTNAGTVDASGIKFKAPSACSSTAGPGQVWGTLTSALSSGSPSGTTLSVTSLGASVRSGQSITLTSGGNTQTFVTTAAASAGATSITVTSQTANFSYPIGTNVSWGPEFGTGNLCTGLQVVIIETDSSYNHVLANPALGCAYGTSAGGGIGCTFASTPALSDVPTSLTALSLASGASGNTSTDLTAGQSRYFLIGVKQPSGLGNTYQDRKASFDLLWHIDQA